MRFTIWSALTNAFVIFTVILPSLIPGANAFYDVVLYFTNPSSSGAVYFAGQESEITWDFSPEVSSSPLSEVILTGDVCNLYLVDGGTGTNYTLATGVPLVNSTKVFGSSGGITFPSEAIPGSNYFIDLESKDVGSWHSNSITIAFH